MTETIQINWLLLIAPFLWILGIAVIVFLLGLMEFSKVSKGISRADFLKRRLFKAGLLVSAGLIIGGLVLNLVSLPSDKFIAVKLETHSRDRFQVVPDRLSFAPGALLMDGHNKSHLLNNEGMKDNTMVLFWDGYIRTPFLRFKPGGYRIEFRAKGSKAEDEFSKIKVEFEVPDENNYLVTNRVKYIELTSRMADYAMDFQSETDTIGRVRLTYFNDLYLPEIKKGRDVWLRDVNVKKAANVE